VLNGFGRALESILPKLRHSYLVESSNEALRLTSIYPHAYFLLPRGSVSAAPGGLRAGQTALGFAQFALSASALAACRRSRGVVETLASE